MSTLSWNCRGLGNPRTVQEIMDIVFAKKPKIIFLMEVKVGRAYMEKMQNKLNYEGMFVMDSVRCGSGLVLLWKVENWVSLISYSRNHIDVQVNILDMV